MSIEELEKSLKKLKTDYEKSVWKAQCDFAIANNTIKIGDTFTDHIGQIEVSAIRVSAIFTLNPICIYTGYVLNKNGTRNKRGDKRDAWQSQEIKQA
jgi:hypothetical protein